jgi:hypothetical protein
VEDGACLESTTAYIFPQARKCIVPVWPRPGPRPTPPFPVCLAFATFAPLCGNLSDEERHGTIHGKTGKRLAAKRHRRRKRTDGGRFLARVSLTLGGALLDFIADFANWDNSTVRRPRAVLFNCFAVGCETASGADGGWCEVSLAGRRFSFRTVAVRLPRGWVSRCGIGCGGPLMGDGTLGLLEPIRWSVFPGRCRWAVELGDRGRDAQV